MPKKPQVFTASYDREGTSKGFQWNVEADGRVIAWDLSHAWARNIRNALNAIETTKGMKLWTIAIDDSDSDEPIVDLVYCDHQPTWQEVIKIHPHLDVYSPDEDGVYIEEYSAPNKHEPIIPTIPHENNPPT